MTADKPPNTTRLCKLRNKASSSIASRVHSTTAATPLYEKKKVQRKNFWHVYHLHLQLFLSDEYFSAYSRYKCMELRTILKHQLAGQLRLFVTFPYSFGKGGQNRKRLKRCFYSTSLSTIFTAYAPFPVINEHIVPNASNILC